MSVALVSPTKGGRKPFASAVLNVEMAGEKRAVRVKAMRTAGVLVWQLIAGAVSAGVVGALVFSSGFRMCVGSVHRPWLFLGQWSFVPSGIMMMHWCCSKWTLHPCLQSGATARRELWRSGKMCAVLVGL